MIRFDQAVYQYYKEEFNLDLETSIGNFDFKNYPVISFSIRHGNQNFYDKMLFISNYLDNHLRMCLEKEPNIEKLYHKTEFITRYFDVYTNQNFNEYKDELKNYIESRRKYVQGMKVYFDSLVDIKKDLENLERNIDELENIQQKLHDAKQTPDDDTEKSILISKCSSNIINIEYNLLSNMFNHLLSPKECWL